jgi:hypothetical protein
MSNIIDRPVLGDKCIDLFIPWRRRGCYCGGCRSNFYFNLLSEKRFGFKGEGVDFE